MKRFQLALSLLLSCALCCFARSEESFIGIYLQGKKIGYSSSESLPDKLAGKPMTKMVSRTYMDMGLLGQPLKVEIAQVSWSNASGKPVSMKFDMNSGGRRLRVEATYGPTDVLMLIDNSGAKSTKKLPFPKDAPIVDDAVTAIMEDSAKIGMSKALYVLDPTTLDFVKNTVTLKGKSKVIVGDLEHDAQLIEIREPRMTMNVYLSSKGDLIKITAIAGMEMIPISKEEALAIDPNPQPVDLADLTKIRVAPPLGDASGFKSVSYQFSGADLSRLPSDKAQVVTGSGSEWSVKTTPLAQTTVGASPISAVKKAHPAWIKPSLNVPSQDPAMVSLAKKLVGKETNSVKAALLIGRYINQRMRFNAGIGVIRDAREIHRTQEGVCRDYAVLTATLLRAAEIPTRVTSGLVYDSEAFYYHAWCEFFDGKNWVGLDTTRDNLKVEVGHIKLAQGNVEDAFLFTFLDSAKVKILSKEPKSKS